MRKVNGWIDLKNIFKNFLWKGFFFFNIYCKNDIRIFLKWSTNKCLKDTH